MRISRKVKVPVAPKEYNKFAMSLNIFFLRSAYFINLIFHLNVCEMAGIMRFTARQLTNFYFVFWRVPYAFTKYLKPKLVLGHHRAKKRKK